jgi:hypothetical protein
MAEHYRASEFGQTATDRAGDRLSGQDGANLRTRWIWNGVKEKVRADLQAR